MQLVLMSYPAWTPAARRALCAAALVALPLAAAVAQDRWAEADRQVRRLAPAAFPALPRAVAADMERRGCTVPQAGDAPAPGNVVQADLARPGQHDWAVLCSIRGASAVVVYWGGRADSAAELAAAADRSYLQSVGGDTIAFSRSLRVASPARVRALARRSGRANLLVDHAGIEDAFSGKGSSVWYLDRGRWLELTGAD